MDWIWYLLLIPAGFLAGIVNTIAGGGSFLTLPALMYVAGLDPQMANGTNRIAILFSSASASLTFNKHGKLDKQLVKQLTLPTMLGVPLGAIGATLLPPVAFKPAIGVIFLLMACLIFSNPKKLLEQRETKDSSRPFIFGLFFAVGIYVGFIQAGMGVLLLISMSWLNTGDLVHSNGVKNAIGFSVTLLAAAFFVSTGQVNWAPGLVMAAGNVLGGFVGAKLAIKKGNKFVLGFLMVVMLLTGIQLLLG